MNAGKKTTGDPTDERTVGNTERSIPRILC